MWLERVSRTATLFITNATKLAGLYVGVRAAVAPSPNAVVLAFAAFMMAGAQVSESAVLAFIERLFPGGGEKR